VGGVVEALFATWYEVDRWEKAGSAMLWKRGESVIISDRLRLTDWNFVLCCYGVLNQLYPRLRGQKCRPFSLLSSPTTKNFYSLKCLANSQALLLDNKSLKCVQRIEEMLWKNVIRTELFSCAL